MVKDIVTNKRPVLIKKALDIYFKRINDLCNEYNGFANYQRVISTLACNFSTKKPEIKRLLFVLKELGYIDIKKKKGIKLNFEYKEDEE
jgi:hypothetical protein